jgi:hypothetical protein
MTRTEAPKDLGGRLERNFARTTPELPCGRVTLPVRVLDCEDNGFQSFKITPDDADLRALDSL